MQIFSLSCIAAALQVWNQSINPLSKIHNKNKHSSMHEVHCLVCFHSATAAVLSAASRGVDALLPLVPTLISVTRMSVMLPSTVTKSNTFQAAFR